MKEMKEIERKKEIAKKEMERKINKEQIAKILRKDMKEMILINTSRSSSLSSNAKFFENSLILIISINLYYLSLSGLLRIIHLQPFVHLERYDIDTESETEGVSAASTVVDHVTERDQVEVEEKVELSTESPRSGFQESDGLRYSIQ